MASVKTPHRKVKLDLAWLNNTLCPYIDMLNHSVHLENADTCLDARENWQVVATKTIKKGEQIYISYDPEPSYHLLLNYGFVDTSRVNKAERVHFNSMVFTVDERRIEFMKEWGLEEDAIYIDYLQGVSWHMQKAALVCTAVLPENGELDESFMDSPSDPGLMAQANSLLQKMIRSKITELQDMIMDTRSQHSLARDFYKAQMMFLREFLSENTDSLYNLLPLEVTIEAAGKDDGSRNDSDYDSG